MTRKWLAGVACVITAPTILLLSGWLIWSPLSWACSGAEAATEIFQGVTYGCGPLERTREGSGLFHWVRVDLTASGIELYVTPLDPAAVANGWQYRLRPVNEVVRDEKLALAINGALFASDSLRWFRLPGDFARGIETVVADHVVSHVWEHTYLLWFDDALTPHLRPSKPPNEVELRGAKWGIGGQGVWLSNGQIWPGSDRSPDARTAVGVDKIRKLLYLAIAQHISPRLMLQKLADLGASDGMLLDGGSSSAMAIGAAARGITTGRYGGFRPVATQFGVRALPLPR